MPQAPTKSTPKKSSSKATQKKSSSGGTNGLDITIQVSAFRKGLNIAAGFSDASEGAPVWAQDLRIEATRGVKSKNNEASDDAVVFTAMSAQAGCVFKSNNSGQVHSPGGFVIHQSAIRSLIGIIAMRPEKEARLTAVGNILRVSVGRAEFEVQIAHPKVPPEMKTILATAASIQDSGVRLSKYELIRMVDDTASIIDPADPVLGTIRVGVDKGRLYYESLYRKGVYSNSVNPESKEKGSIAAFHVRHATLSGITQAIAQLDSDVVRMSLEPDPDGKTFGSVYIVGESGFVMFRTSGANFHFLDWRTKQDVDNQDMRVQLVVDQAAFLSMISQAEQMWAGSSEQSRLPVKVKKEGKRAVVTLETATTLGKFSDVIGDAEWAGKASHQFDINGDPVVRVLSSFASEKVEIGIPVSGGLDDRAGITVRPYGDDTQGQQLGLISLLSPTGKKEDSNE